MLHVASAAARVENRDTRLGKVSLDRAAAATGALETHLVRALGVGDVDLPAVGVDRHVEQDRAHRRKYCAFRERRGVDREHIVVRQREAADERFHVVPRAAECIDPIAAVVTDNQTSRGLVSTFDIYKWWWFLLGYIRSI